MGKGIHILGPSGSGATTLGQALSKELGYTLFDSDDYYWIPTNPPYQVSREKEERQKLLMDDISKCDGWIISGSFCGWGDIFIPMFDLVIYLFIPKELRLKRLIQREIEYFGHEAILPGGMMYENFSTFMSWATKYEEGGMDMKSRILHEEWLKKILCPIIRLEEDMPVYDRVKCVVEKIKEI